VAKLVAVGDSLVQGSMSLATTHPDRSFPAIVARCLGLGAADFPTPDFSGEGGLPFNLEWMARRLEQDFGPHIHGLEWVAAAVHIARYLDDVEDYWERGPGSQPTADALHHNAGVWSFQVCDAYTTTPRACDRGIGRDRPEWLEPPAHGRLRTARRVINPARLGGRQDDTQLSIARRIKARDGGIDNLIALIGANNCLRAVWDLEIRETGPHSPGPGTACTLWTESAFAEEYGKLAAELAGLGAGHVYVGTVPHVSGLPVSRGLMRGGGPLPPGRTYYDLYTRVWLEEGRFDERRDPHLTGDQMRRIDDRIDAYNGVIRARAAAHGFHVVDLAALIDALDWHRHHGAPPFPLPAAIADLDSRFFEIDAHGARTQGGLVSLDGLHPTTCGYGLFAQAFVDAIRPFEPAIADVDFAALRASDTLVSAPPRTIHDVYGMLETMEKRFHLSRWLSIEDEDGIRIDFPWRR
jgi:hypothetical protein